MRPLTAKDIPMLREEMEHTENHLVNIHSNTFGFGTSTDISNHLRPIAIEFLRSRKADLQEEIDRLLKTTT